MSFIGLFLYFAWRYMRVSLFISRFWHSLLCLGHHISCFCNLLSVSSFGIKHIYIVLQDFLPVDRVNLTCHH